MVLALVSDATANAIYASIPSATLGLMQGRCIPAMQRVRAHF
jgi:hypothetical protein